MQSFLDGPDCFLIDASDKCRYALSDPHGRSTVDLPEGVDAPVSTSLLLHHGELDGAGTWDDEPGTIVLCFRYWRSSRYIFIIIHIDRRRGKFMYRQAVTERVSGPVWRPLARYRQLFKSGLSFKE